MRLNSDFHPFEEEKLSTGLPTSWG